jgi:hypothetical protein
MALTDKFRINELVSKGSKADRRDSKGRIVVQRKDGKEVRPTLSKEVKPFGEEVIKAKNKDPRFKSELNEVDITPNEEQTSFSGESSGYVEKPKYNEEELVNEVSRMTSKELKRDLLLFARNNPVLFLELANDENINIRNVGIKAVENNIIDLSSDQRTFTWASTGRKLITVPFDENPYSALAAWFKTDEGIEVYQTVEKRVK